MSVLPGTTQELMKWTWHDIEPFYRELEARKLTETSVRGWLADWSRLSEHVAELYHRLSVATTVNTADKRAEIRYQAYLDDIEPRSQAAEQALKQKLLASGLQPAGFAIPLRNMRAEAALFREANLPLLTTEQKMCNEYDKIIGAQTAQWDGKEVTLTQLLPELQSPQRSRREQVWRLAAARRLADRGAIAALWQRYLRLRRALAANAGFGDDYRAYRWQYLQRFDYTPEDCKSFARAIEQVVVPAASRIYERRRQRLGVSSVRPWDLEVDPRGLPPLRPFARIGRLERRASAIFHQVDPQLGEYFDIMRREGLLDLANRKNKAPGAYCADYPAVKRPFIFENAVGLHEDVQSILHEAGHAFHVFETCSLPYTQQTNVGMEFAEVASQAMELLAAPYLSAERGGFYSKQDAARAVVEHLEKTILFWPYMAVVDSFQHWVYENPDAALDAAECDAAWTKQWRRFMPGVDYTGLSDEMANGWQTKLHIHQIPFYYVEYGLAQLGAVQVWRNALTDQAAAVQEYRRALALGSTVTLPELFAAAGATFAFDAATIHACVSLMEESIDKLQ